MEPARSGYALVLACISGLSFGFGDVRQLESDADFAAFVQQDDNSDRKVMVNFGSKWCGHCNVFAPEYERAASFLREHNVQLAKVDCPDFGATDQSLCDDVEAYPTLRVYHGDRGAFTSYLGGRKAEDIISHFTHGKYTTSTSTVPAPNIPASRPTGPAQLSPFPNATATDATFLADDGSYAIVKVQLPGVPMNIPDANSSLNPSSSLILEFGVSATGKHLTVNEQLLALQVPDPSRPAALSAVQVPVDWDMGRNGIRHRTLTASHGFRPLDLDYELHTHHPDDPSIIYYNYNPVVDFNLIGSSSPDSGKYTDFILDSLDQKIITVTLCGRNGPVVSDDPERLFKISKIQLIDRPEYYRVPQPDDSICNLWSWRCSDLSDPPWYRFVWRQNFDDFGRIGCLRREILLRWSMVEKVLPVPHLPFVVATPLLLVVFWYVISKGFKKDQSMIICEKSGESVR